MIREREKGQSQLDYLWVNFGEYEVLKTTTNEDKIIPSLATVNKLIEQSSSSPKLDNYYTKQEVDEKLALIDTSESNLAEIKNQLQLHQDMLLKLNGTSEQEGSVLNIVTNQIQSAFDWKEL